MRRRPRRGFLGGPAAAAVLLLAVPSAAASAGPQDPTWSGAATTVPAGAPPLPQDVSATSFLVADLDTGAVWAAHDVHHRLLPASTLKVLTALTLMPLLPPAQQVVPSLSDVEVDGTRVGLVEHVPYSAAELFRALLMVSGNDAADALADAVGGQPRAAALMQAEARRVGARDTHVVNPSGLDAPGQLTTAYDLAVIARAAMRLPGFRADVATEHASIRGRDGHLLPISSHDKLLYNYPGAIGIKNGYTVHAGATFIGAATRDHHTVLVTVLHARPRVWPEVAHLLDWGLAVEEQGLTPVGQLPEPALTTTPVRAASAVRSRTVARASRSSAPLDVLAGGLTSMLVGSVLRRRRGLAGR